uniref:NADH-ubiquinone oxidoreductase chain 5 n=1 Tax=Colochirus quadrangularis TaxID=1980634 RepID=A0A7G7MWM4_9ECHN|nr:NADH dehydrogenase subunit 5 [Colochirus quadrangularis]QNG57233.1 NADH dehydrogenase subunit 5 [Colochirus quadrangularis]
MILYIPELVAKQIPNIEELSNIQLLKVVYPIYHLALVLTFMSALLLKNPKNILITFKITAILSITSNILYLYLTNNINGPTIDSFNIWQINTSSFLMLDYINLTLDYNFIIFSTTAIIVTWSIIEFSIYYMSNDQNLTKFLHTLCVFLFFMFAITAANNIHVLFVGWEGVGILSFMLISWWFTRKDANSAAIQAIIYNRIGDIGLILLAAGLYYEKAWQINCLSSIENENTKNIILIASIIAATGKSAQFSLHPWLPAAMEGPTPVSALLHSSTMVVAGVFLLVRITNYINPPNIMYICSIIGSITAIFAATTAFRQHDIKKIIAYSTTSQLGLMFIAIGINLPNMALFHICTHAFFKAMLFLCSGSIIHSYNNEQDLRKLSNINSTLPITSACLLLGSLSLMGIPFLSGFFSKDIILENINNSPINIIIFILASTATILTAAYSFRIITFCFLTNPSNSSINYTNEENKNLTNPLIRLAIGSIITGWIISNWLTETPNCFQNETFKNIPFVCSIIGAAIASTIILNISNNVNITFFTNNWFYQNILHNGVINISANTTLTLTSQTIDRGWNETLGPQGISSLNNKISINNQLTQSSYLKQYLLSITLIITTFLALLIIL